MPAKTKEGRKLDDNMFVRVNSTAKANFIKIAKERDDVPAEVIRWYMEMYMDEDAHAKASRRGLL